MSRIVFGALSLALLILAGCSSTRGSDDLEPTVILISLDGFRPDYLETHDAPTVKRLAEEGVFAEEGMLPSFPSNTFPNHYTIATGLYPANHGIVGNTMYDPEFDAYFRLSDREAVEDARWWGGEPIWVTAEKQGQKAATYFWVGSEAPVMGIRPSFWKTYDASIPGDERIDEVLGWIDLPKAERPTFISLYYSAVDGAGHRFGPESDRTRQAVAEVDGYLARLVSGLESRGILDKVNIIVVSDHGMAPVSRERLVVLEDYLDPAAARLIDIGTMLMLEPNPGRMQEVEAAITAMPHVTLLPEAERANKYNFAGHRRIPSVVAMADEGWTVARTRAFVEDRPEYPSGGSHGYEPSLPSMRALFVARGPAFAEGKTIPPFQNVDIYPLLCDLLDLEPAPNDGALDDLRAARR